MSWRVFFNGFVCGMTLIAILAVYMFTCRDDTGNTKEISVRSVQAEKAPVVARAAIDTDGDTITDSTELGDIDMESMTVGDLKGVVAPNYSNVSNAAMSSVSGEDVTNAAWSAAIVCGKYFYDKTTETLYRFGTDDDYTMLKAVTNVPPTIDVIRELERQGDSQNN